MPNVGPWLVHSFRDGGRTGRYRLWAHRRAAVALLAEPSVSGGYWWGSGDSGRDDTDVVVLVGPMLIGPIIHGRARTLWGACAAADQWLRKLVEVSGGR